MKRFLATRYHDFKVQHSMKFVTKTNAIDLSIGDSDLTTDSEVLEKTYIDMQHGHTHYANPYGIPELRSALCNTFREDYNIDFNVDECLVTTSGNHALWLALTAIINPGDEVIVFEPFYPFYPQQIKAAGGIPVLVPLDGATGFHLDIDTLRKNITTKTKAIIINSPNNPTGAFYTSSELNALSELVIEHDFVVITDEVYANYCYNGTYSPFAKIENMRKHTITIGSFSKDYVMTGFRVGFVFTSPDLIKIMKEINENNTFTAPTISQRAALHALSARARIRAALSNEFQARVTYLYEQLSSIPGLVPIRPEGAIFLFVDVSQTGKTGDELTELLLNEANIIVIAGSSYGKSSSNYIRITAARDIAHLTIAMERLRSFMLKLMADVA